MRRAARVDNTQADIVKALRMAAMTVQPLHTIGKGVPDLLVGWRGRNVLLELKTGNARLTADETGWHEKWAGQVATVSTPDDAVDAVLRACGTGSA